MVRSRSRRRLAPLAIAGLLVLSLVVVDAADWNNGTQMPPWMTCLRVNSVGDMCDVQSVCARCVRTPGCAFDTLVRECTELPANGRAMYTSSSNALLNRTNLHYCNDSDPLCATCVVSSTTPFCEGADACVCPSLCLSQRATQLSCYAIRQGNMMYISVAVMAIALPLLVVMHRVCWSARRGGYTGSDIQAELRRMREQRRLELARLRQRQRPASAMALQLESWRTHRDEHKVEIDKVEPLKSCYVLMDHDDAATAPAERRQQDDALEEGLEPPPPPSPQAPTTTATPSGARADV